MTEECVESTVLEEFEKAKKEGRQPRCVYCEAPLEVRQFQYTTLTWRWNDFSKEYEKSEDGEADEPTCMKCGAKDWDFVDEDLVDY